MSLYKSGLLASTIFAFSCPALAQAQDLNSVDEDVIIVTASPLSRSIDEAITGQSILAGDALEDRLAATIGETLKLEPGLSSTAFGAGASRPIIRGQGGDRVRVLTNGIGSIDASSASPDHAVAVEPAQAERIEVLRGAALLRYGSSGAGGVVNVIDGRIPNSVPDGTDVTVRVGASSVDNGANGAVSLDQSIGNGFVIHADGAFRNADDYRIPVEGESRAQLAEEGEEVPDDFDEGRRLDNSFTESSSTALGLSYVGDGGFIGVSVQGFDTTYGVPGGHGHEEEEGDAEEEGEEEEEGGVSIVLDQTRYDVNGAIDLDGFISRLQVFGGYADYTHTEFEPNGEAGTVFTNEGYEVRVEAIQAERGNWTAAHGVQLRQRDFSAVGEEAFVPPTKTDQLGVYTFHEIEIGKGHLEAAARYERTDQEDRTGGQDRKFDLISISGGGDVHVSDALRIGGTVLRTERAPTTEELFSNGPHLATEQFEVGNPDLKKEIATGVELALRHRENGHAVTLNLFYTDYKDYIFESETGGEEDGLPVFAFTGEDAKFYGFEAVGEVDVTTVGAFDVSADTLVEYVRAKTDTGNLPRIPPLSVLTGVNFDADRVTLRGEWEYVAKADELAFGELPTDDYNQANAYLTWRAPLDAQDVALRLSVINVFDTEARNHSSFLKDLVPLPGRNIRLSLTAKL